MEPKIWKEYYDLSTIKKSVIGLLMMVKNEKLKILTTLNSIKSHVDCLIIYDTGSTDNTIELIDNFCINNKINLYLIQGEFVNFCVSRNVLLDFADTIKEVDFLLLLDCNDELKNGEELRTFANKELTSKDSAYLVCQEWKTNLSGGYDKYYNVRFIKRGLGWRYKGSVHEYIHNENRSVTKRFPDNIVLFQDRTNDDDKTGKRFKRDKELLLEEHKKDRTEPRTIFYLAQTCGCLNHVEDAYYYYKLRLNFDGFFEEKFHCLLRLGDLSIEMKHPWHETMAWYMKAYEFIPRVEPLIKIAHYYKSCENWKLSFMFASLACELEYPEDLILFVNKNMYTYDRWHLMGIVAFYNEKYEIGEKACLKALKANPKSEIDKKNLSYYIQKKTKVVETKAEFFNRMIPELKKQYPNLKMKQINSKVNKLWKNK